MENINPEDFSTKHIGHLGLVADKIDHLKLIDQRILINMAQGAKVSHGERVAAMIMNGLGFIDNRLYLFPEFMKDKPVDILFGRELKAEWFNKEAKALVSSSISKDAFNSLDNGYSYYATTSNHGGVKQCWLLIYSEAAYQREIKALERKIKKLSEEENTESGFKFIKDDAFQVDSVFLKTPARIEALMMIMTLCLMVYGVTEYQLHHSLKNAKETIVNQTNTPSLHWVYFLFRGVNELNIKKFN